MRVTSLARLLFKRVLLEHGQNPAAHRVVHDGVHLPAAVGGFLEVDLQQVLQVLLLQYVGDPGQQHRLIADHLMCLRTNGEISVAQNTL